MVSRPGFKTKYARVERERRFLLDDVPDGAVLRTTRIVDRYIVNTGLRLRRAEENTESGEQTVHKLTQKLARPGGGPGLITTIYLSESEYEALAAIPAERLAKTRLSIPPFGIDVFESVLRGLLLAEIEFETDDDMLAFSAPGWAIAEVTDDVRFTGGQLLHTASDRLARLLGEFGVRP
jgi:CYTH domain-containing protein